MFRLYTASLALVLTGLLISVKNATAPMAAIQAMSASLRPPASPASSAYDSNAERELLRLANESRARAGAPPLREDPGMTQAARTHTAAMMRRQQLSHQFPGEPGLMPRVTASCSLHLDQAAENVASSGSAAGAHDGLMHSPPHRENLLNPAYNVVGIGAMWNGNVLYVTEDFAHSLPTYSEADAEKAVAESVARTRRDAGMRGLRWIENAAARTTACAMARADSIDVSGPPGHTNLRYTTMRPENLPSSAARVIDDPGTQGFAVGSCYARTVSYPSGVYWVALIFYSAIN